MMFATRAVHVFVFFAILAAASARVVPSHPPIPPPKPKPTPPVGQCGTGPIQCCNQVVPAKSNSATDLLGLLGIVLEDLNVDVGLTCSPISVIGLGSGECNASPACCKNNKYNGLIAIGCVPINIGI